MSGKLIWVVRLIGIVVFLVLVYLLLSLHTRLVQMNEGGGGRPLASGTDCELRIADCEMTLNEAQRMSDATPRGKS